MRYASLTVRLYRWIAQAFPETFLRAHGEEMVYASEEMIQETAAREGVPGLFRMAPRLLFDLFHRIVVEYAAEIQQDVRYAVRNLRHQKVSAITAVLSLSLGISGVTVMYSQVESTMLRDIPEIRDPEELLAFQARVSYPDYERFRDRSGQFESLAAYIAKVPLTARVDGNSERVWSHIVTENYFSTLGAAPIRGRLLGEKDRKDASLVISHKFWKDKLAGSPRVIGQIIHVNGQPVTIVGVTAENFRGTSPMLAAADIFLPVGIGPQIAPELRDGILEKRLSAFTLIGRLRASTTVKQAEVVLDGQMRTMEQEANDPARDRKGRRVTLIPGGKIFPVRKEDIGVFIGLPLALMGLMLWIACANVATLILAKALGRRKEIATRLSLGASRSRLVRQLLTESMLLAVVGGTLGIVWFLLANRIDRPIQADSPGLHGFAGVHQLEGSFADHGGQRADWYFRRSYSRARSNANRFDHRAEGLRGVSANEMVGIPQCSGDAAGGRIPDAAANHRTGRHRVPTQ